ncbi:hypothetical protein SAMN05444377_103133 [Flavobacterium fontis]|uniref:Uncharacterized protein n=1 Tax=Flavobacterium fontis TaxID=1124188 RepID=A0A1M4YK88_9FLAO|nr:hypothetical protein SAMN05444377_103133 [Flavobacterium fontis]
MSNIHNCDGRIDLESEPLLIKTLSLTVIVYPYFYLVLIGSI